MLFIWDAKKAKANVKRHKVSFELATTVFDDRLHLSVVDGKERGEERWVTLGQAADLKTLVVVHTYMNDEDDEVVRTSQPELQPKRRNRNMKKEYSFKGGVRGKFHRPNKVQKTVRFDPDVLDFYVRLARKEGIPYQTLINLTLRKFATEGGVLTIAGRPKSAA